MNGTLELLKENISNQDEFTKLYLLGFIRGQLHNLKEFGDYKDEKR
ncbi:MAG: hypothetical protein ACQERX_02185 [Bacillota bacterium]